MSGDRLCAKCKRPASGYLPLAWDSEGRLAHDDSIEWRPCAQRGDDACDHPGADCTDVYCDSSNLAAGFKQCASCEMAVRPAEMVGAQKVQPFLREDGEYQPERDWSRVRWEPAGRPAPYFDRIEDTFERPGDLEGLPPGTRGLVLDGGQAICRRCASFVGGDGWKPLRRSSGASKPAGSDDGPLEKIPVDGKWRKLVDFPALLEMSKRASDDFIRDAAKSGHLEVDEEQTKAGGSRAKLYRRVSREQ